MTSGETTAARRADLVVVGAGISGLAVAHHAARAGLATVVLEAGERIGGCVRSRRLGDGFWLELGAHTAYNSYGSFLAMAEDRELLGLLGPRAKVPFKLWVDGEVRSITSALSFWELLVSLPRALGAKKERRTVASYYGAIAGRRNYARLLGPALGAVVSQRPDDFPADMLFQRRARRKDVLRKFTVAGGLQTVLDAVAAAPGVEVVTGAEVVEVARAPGGGFEVRTAAGDTLTASALALAVPPPAAGRLLSEAWPEVAERLGRIQTVAVDSVGVVVPREAVHVEEVAGLIPLDDVFTSVVTRDVVPHERWRGFVFHFKAGLDDEARLERIRQVLGSDDFEDVTTASVVLPSPTLGHRELTAEVDALIAGQPLILAGNYWKGLALEECVARSAQEVARLLALRAGP